MLGSRLTDARRFTMAVRNFTRLLTSLCLLLFVAAGASIAGVSHAIASEPASTASTPPSIHAPELGNDSIRNGSRSDQSAVAGTIPLAARNTLKALEERHGDPLPGYVGGRPFLNRERILPRGRYREYDVHPKVPGRNRGGERIVIDQGTGKAYYTADHYRSFIPMN